jgi:immune inhibitor A
MWPNGYKVYEGDPNTTADDIYIGPYTIQPENLDLGVVVEEFGHNFFGLPDIYTTDGQNSSGFWTEMSFGSWGGTWVEPPL